MTKSKTVDRVPWEDVLTPRGLVGDVARWIRESSTMAQPKFALAGALTIPAKVKSISAGAFAGTPITSLTIEAGAYLETISSSAFKGCASLASVTIPGNVKNINESAFAMRYGGDDSC